MRLKGELCIKNLSVLSILLNVTRPSLSSNNNTINLSNTFLGFDRIYSRFIAVTCLLSSFTFKFGVSYFSLHTNIQETVSGAEGF